MSYINLGCSGGNCYMVIRNSAVILIINRALILYGNGFASIGRNFSKRCSFGNYCAAGCNIIRICFSAESANTIIKTVTFCFNFFGVRISARAGKGFYAFFGTSGFSCYFAVIINMIYAIIFKAEKANCGIITTVFLEGNCMAFSLFVKSITFNRSFYGLGSVFVFGIVPLSSMAMASPASEEISVKGAPSGITAPPGAT